MESNKLWTVNKLKSLTRDQRRKVIEEMETADLDRLISTVKVTRGIKDTKSHDREYLLLCIKKYRNPSMLSPKIETFLKKEEPIISSAVPAAVLYNWECYMSYTEETVSGKRNYSGVPTAISGAMQAISKARPEFDKAPSFATKSMQSPPLLTDPSNQHQFIINVFRQGCSTPVAVEVIHNMKPIWRLKNDIQSKTVRSMPGWKILGADELGNVIILSLQKRSLITKTGGIYALA